LTSLQFQEIKTLNPILHFAGSKIKTVQLSEGVSGLPDTSHESSFSKLAPYNHPRTKGDTHTSYGKPANSV